MRNKLVFYPLNVHFSILSLIKIGLLIYTKYILKSRKIRCSVGVYRVPPKGNNTNTETNSGFVLFFSNDYFGIRIELWILTTIAGRKQSLGFFYAEKDWKNCKNMLYSIKKNMLIVSKALATLKLIADYNSYRGGKHWKRTRK